jgi:hypothetical protein
MTETSSKFIQLMGRVYFIAIIPFFGGAIAPWIVGPTASAEVPAFLLWSFTVLIFCVAGWFGFSSASHPRCAPLHLFISLAICGCAIGAFLAQQSQNSFVAAAILTVLHWLHLLWVQKAGSFDKEVLKQYRRFIWTTLACHMMVLLNMIYAVKTA